MIGHVLFLWFAHSDPLSPPIWTLNPGKLLIYLSFSAALLHQCLWHLGCSVGCDQGVEWGYDRCCGHWHTYLTIISQKHPSVHKLIKVALREFTCITKFLDSSSVRSVNTSTTHFFADSNTSLAILSGVCFFLGGPSIICPLCSEPPAKYSWPLSPLEVPGLDW